MPPISRIFDGKRLAFYRLMKQACSIKESNDNINYMNLLLLVVILLLLFGGGGFYFGGPVIGGSGLGLVLLICLIIFLAGGFRSTKI